MSFRDNLQHLRATRNMTQEQLAMLVGVSRQSVTKWEAERAYPEMDKLLKLCQIFDCTLDELVQGDLTTREAESALSMPAAALAEDVVGYDEHHRVYARKMATGIAICILGAAVASTMDGWMGDGPTALGFFGCIGIGLMFIIPAALEHSAFQKAHPYVANFYTDEQIVSGKHAFGIRLAAGIGILLATLVFGAFGDQYGFSSRIMGLFFVGIAGGVALIVYSALIDNRLDVEAYNINALEELSEEEIAGIVGADRAPQVLRKVRASRRVNKACGVIMLVATAIALPLMFWATDFGDPFWSRFFWIPWMVGGLFCGIVSILLEDKGGDR